MKRNITYLKIISLCNGLVFYAPVALLLRTSRGISAPLFFILQMILYSSICLLEIPCGFLTDKIGYKKSIVLSMLCLTIARIQFLYANHFFIFAVECLLEGISICLISGTMNAYLYEETGEKGFDQILSRIDNWGTIGFIISTVSFYFLYDRVGLNGLVMLTVVGTFIALFFSIKLKDIGILKNQQKKRGFDLWKQSDFWKMALVSSVFSMGTIAINFFYVVKLETMGIKEVNLTWIILMYSLIQLLVPRILKYLDIKSIHNIIAKFIGLAGISFIVLFLSPYLLLNLCLMFIILTFIMTAFYVLSKVQNVYIDSLDMNHNRATLLSLFNMGSHFLSIGSFLFLSAYSDAS